MAETIAALPRSHPGQRSSATPAPHLDITTHKAAATETSAPPSGHIAWGQVLAYLGVLGLTGGATMIIWSYFGDAPVDGPTAWLVAATGQMLLFLGVITLVSSGIEQTNQDVIRQVRKLGDQLLRIEQATDHPRVPSPKSSVTGNATRTDKADRTAVPQPTGKTNP